MTTQATYTEAQIAEAVELYAEFHGVEADAVDVCRNYEGEAVVGFRLSLDVTGEQRGADEKHGICN